jgi:hypothetical protein
LRASAMSAIQEGRPIALDVGSGGIEMSALAGMDHALPRFNRRSVRVSCGEGGALIDDEARCRMPVMLLNHPGIDVPRFFATTSNGTPSLCTKPTCGGGGN